MDPDDDPESGFEPVEVDAYVAMPMSRRSNGGPATEQLMRVKKLKMNTYDAFLFTACSIEDDSIQNDFWVWFQLLFAGVMQIAAVFSQIMLTVLLFATVVEEAENPYEHGLDDATAEVQKAIAQHEVLGKDQASIQLCRSDHTVGGVHTVVILIWVSRMIREIADSVELIMIYVRMPLPAVEGEIVQEKIEFNSRGVILNERYSILSMTIRLKMLSLFVGMSRLIVASLLTFTSSKYLILSGNMANVILKAVSMQFIVALDEIIFASFMPASFGMKMAGAQLIYAGQRPSLSAQWGMSTFYVLFACVAVYCMGHVIYPQLSFFRVACRDYYELFPDERSQLMNPMAAINQALKETFVFAS
jgi:hypothetical protein